MKDPKDVHPGDIADPPALVSLMAWLQNPPLRQCPCCSRTMESTEPAVVVVVHPACATSQWPHP